MTEKKKFKQDIAIKIWNNHSNEMLRLWILRLMIHGATFWAVLHRHFPHWEWVTNFYLDTLDWSWALCLTWLPADGNINQSCPATLLKMLPCVSSALVVWQMLYLRWAQWPADPVDWGVSIYSLLSESARSPIKPGAGWSGRWSKAVWRVGSSRWRGRWTRDRPRAGLYGKPSHRVLRWVQLGVIGRTLGSHHPLRVSRLTI